jgi:hypothetical protein
MASFSERYGYKSTEKVLQREMVDESLRMGIWNSLNVTLWDRWSFPSVGYGYSEASAQVNNLVLNLWVDFFKADLDDLPEFKSRYAHKKSGYHLIKERFRGLPWNEVYDFLDFLLGDELVDQDVIRRLNFVLEREGAVYRIVGRKIAEMTDENEIKAIEDALADPEAAVRTHIEAALGMMTDREKPDFRNSIKESISAVEAACRIVTGSATATLGQALKNIPELHPCIQKAFSSLYGFTNDAPGIRHSLLDEPTLNYSDAKFMLSSCSAFVSYLRSLTSR